MIWSDPDWCALCEAEQQLFLLLLTQPGLPYAGVVPFTAGRWQSLAADTTPVRLRKAIQALASARFVVIAAETEELLICSHLRNDGLLDSPNICCAVVRDFETVCSPLLRAVIVCEAVRLQPETPRLGNDRSWDEVLTPWLEETLPQTFGGTFPQTLSPAQHRTLTESYPAA